MAARTTAPSSRTGRNRLPSAREMTPATAVAVMAQNTNPPTSTARTSRASSASRVSPRALAVARPAAVENRIIPTLNSALCTDRRLEAALASAAAMPMTTIVGRGPSRKANGTKNASSR